MSSLVCGFAFNQHYYLVFCSSLHPHPPGPSACFYMWWSDKAMSFFPACPASSSSIWCHHWNTLPRLLLSSTRVYRRGHLLTFLMKIFNLHTKMLLNQLIKSNDIWDEKRKYNKTEIQSLLKIHHRKRQLTMFSAKTWPYTVCASGSLHLIFTPFPAKSNEHNERNWRI